MVKFERRDPFPLLSLNSVSKSIAQSHAADVDAWLGLRVSETEAKLASVGSRSPARDASGARQNLWFGLEPRDLQTPYVEIRALLEPLIPRERSFHVIDLGAAYARMAFVIERHFPLANFTGFEYVGERVEEARRVLTLSDARRSKVEHVDLTSPSFRMPAADLYFVYDYGTPAAVEKTLHDLKRAARERAVIVVARGRMCRYAIESRHAGWLAKANPLAEETAATVYKSLLCIDRIKAPVQNAVKVINGADHA